MKFEQLLIGAIERAEIPLRFEPGAEEAVARPVAEMIRAWIQVHEPESPHSDFDYGQKALIAQLLAELDGTQDVPS